MTIYLHEIIRTVPGREEPYMASVLSLLFIPGRDYGTGGEPGRSAVAQFRTAETSGAWPGVINIWEHTWESMSDALARQFRDERRDARMEDWWNRNLHLRRGGYDRLLVPSDYSPTLGALIQEGFKAKVFLHEIAWHPFGKVDEYLRGLAQGFLPVATRLGLRLVGAYRVAMRPCQTLTLYGFREWQDLARLMEERERDPQLREWFEYRDVLVRNLEELVLLPGRMTPLGLRD